MSTATRSNSGGLIAVLFDQTSLAGGPSKGTFLKSLQGDIIKEFQQLRETIL